MKKYLIPAGILCTAAVAAAGTIAYKRMKRNTKDDIIFYPVGRYVIHENDMELALDDLIKGADLVVHGRAVGRTGSRWNTRHSLPPKTPGSKDQIFFDYFIDPIEILAGVPTDEKELRLRAFEGTVGGYTIEDNSQPKLQEGQELLLFLKEGRRTDPSAQPFYTVHGRLQGLFIQENGKLRSCCTETTVEEVQRRIGKK